MGSRQIDSRSAKEAEAEAIGNLLGRIRTIWQQARQQAARSVNTAHVCANWLIGQQIVQAEQGGAARAGYGLSVLKKLSARLSESWAAAFR